MNERRVVNAEEIFKVLSTSLVDGYRFVVVQSVRPALEIDLMMHALWQQFARVVVKAKVLMGSHGK
jgi:hypothetical protein